MSAASAAGGGSILRGTLWMLAAALGWMGMAVAVRLLEGRVPSWDLSFYRALVALLIGAGPMLYQRGWRLASLVPRRELTGAYLYRGGVMFAAQATYYHALMYMPLADATVLNATVPIFSTVLAIFLLGERVRADRWLFILLGFAGVLVIVRPGLQEVPIEALFALASAVLFALGGIQNKRLVPIESGTAIVYGTNMYIAVFGLVVVLIWGVRPSLLDFVIIGGIGACGAVAQYFFSRALVHADVSYLTPFEFLRVPLVAIAAWILFEEVQPVIFGVGAFLIFGSVFLLARSAMRARPHLPFDGPT